MSAIVNTLNLIAAVFILVASVNSVNQIHARSSHIFRFAYILLATGAAYILLTRATGHVVTTLGELAINVGVAVLLAAERRSVPWSMSAILQRLSSAFRHEHSSDTRR